MTQHQPKQPGWDPRANPVKLKCPGNRVYGWVYPDGTIETICNEKNCRRQGFETRHLFNPLTGLSVPIYVEKR